MANVLMFMSEHESSDTFKESLAISGIDGTLKRIWNSKETKGRVKGKSGYMNGVLGYAGYITTKSNKKLTFCIIVNRFTRPVADVRKLIETDITKIILEN
jgi:D-alanyl-D-alanine carboxypeptidase/D-alanyl-D-alanine-endopeptidase (penicillin-binding protein 4)